MTAITIIVVLVVAVLAFKFIVKPLFKVGALVVLALLAWWFLKGF